MSQSTSKVHQTGLVYSQETSIISSGQGQAATRAMETKHKETGGKWWKFKSSPPYTPVWLRHLASVPDITAMATPKPTVIYDQLINVDVSVDMDT